jgi:hypothetical protein
MKLSYTVLNLSNLPRTQKISTHMNLYLKVLELRLDFSKQAVHEFSSVNKQDNRLLQSPIF